MIKKFGFVKSFIYLCIAIKKNNVMLKRFKCCYCNKIAQWRNPHERFQFYCVDCLKKHSKLTKLSEFSGEGFFKQDFEKHYIISEDDVHDAFINNSGYLLGRFKDTIEEAIDELFFLYSKGDFVDYNLFMSDVGILFKEIESPNAKKFYNFFRMELKNKKIQISEK